MAHDWLELVSRIPAVLAKRSRGWLHLWSSLFSLCVASCLSVWRRGVLQGPAAALKRLNALALCIISY